jgi:hypothetical protein
MRKYLPLLLVVALLVAMMAPNAAVAQRKNVTFRVNTATVPDTLNKNSVVVVTGSGKPKDADSIMTGWGSGIKFTNIGGDYWTATASFAVGDTAVYKIRIGSGGWEKDLTDGDGAGGHRQVIVTKDTTLPLQFWNNRQTAQPSLFTPWPASADTFINVWVRVNMKAVTDNLTFSWTAKDKDSVGVRGDGKNGNMSWGTTLFLTQEQTPGDGASQFTIPPTSFYSGVVKIPKSQVNAGDVINYKFLLGSNWGRDELGGQPNRTFTIPVGKKDTTLQWVWYNNAAPISVVNSDTVVIKFNTNLSQAVAKGGFKNGDTVVVQGGFFGTGVDNPHQRQLARQGLTNIYSYQDTIIGSLQKYYDYQYYWNKLGNSVREQYYNFQYTGSINSEAERRQILLTSKNMVVWDTVNSVSAARRQPYFPDQSKLSKNVLVTWVVDMRPAYYAIKAGKSLLDGQGSANVTYVDSIKAWGVAINGPATGGWGTWDQGLVKDTSARKMYDNGTHGDVAANDSFYTVQIAYTTANTKGVEFKFGIRGGDNESGYGLNHVENIDDSNPTYTMRVQWGSINPNFYSAWDYTNGKPATGTAVAEGTTVPKVFALEQNYPNPFNPATKIRFALPEQSVVELKVFNVLGQLVATLVNNETLKSGSHTVSFDATNLASGLYFYRINAGQFTSTKKMMLIK